LYRVSTVCCGFPLVGRNRGMENNMERGKIDEILAETTILLQDLGIDATYEYPGFISVDLKGPANIEVGCVNDGGFGAQLTDVNGDSVGLDFDMPMSTTAPQLAKAIVELKDGLR